MFIKAKDTVKTSKIAQLLQKIPLGIKVKLLIFLILALIISPMVAAFVENLVIRFTALDKFEYFALVQTGISLLTTSTIIMLLVNILVIIPMYQTIANAQKISEGNLIDFNSLASRDEMGSLSDAIYTMKEELRGIVIDVRKIAEQITDGSKEVEIAIESNVSAVQQIAASTNDFTVKSQNINTKAKKISEVANNISVGIKKGEADLDDAAEYTQTTRTTIKKSVEQVQELNSMAEEISKVVQIITDISEETHLLSFNASIEAARAGEHGRGFAVVADQIGKLADESKKSAQEINVVISSIQDKTKQTEQEILRSEEDIEKTSKMMISTVTVLNSIITELEDLFDDIDLISANTEEINAATQDIAASTQEQSASLQEVSALTEKFNCTVEALRGLLDRFNV